MNTERLFMVANNCFKVSLAIRITRKPLVQYQNSEIALLPTTPSSLAPPGNDGDNNIRAARIMHACIQQIC